MDGNNQILTTTAIPIAALLALLWQFPMHAQEPLPSDVLVFINQRTRCDHFREEPWPEGGTPAEKERREFLSTQMEHYCKGTDIKLRELRERYRDDLEVSQRLSTFETSIEVK